MNREYIKLENVTKVIKHNKVLDNVSLVLEENKIYGLEGINGSGKTMLLRAIAGLIRVEGSVIVDGEEIGEDNFPKDIGVLIENPGFLEEFTAKENLKLLALIQKGVTDEDIENVLIKVGLSLDDKKKYGKFSLGMKERLGIAQAILKSPKLVLLDEPTNAVDKDGMSELINIVKELKAKGSTVVIASHDKDFLGSVADKTYTMRQGAIV
jgi:ABC-2 type transport system ATP-binding protein